MGLRRLIALLASTIAILIGWFTLLGLLWTPELMPSVISTQQATALTTIWRGIAEILLRLATITIATTILIGVVNLLWVHANRVFRRQGGALNSLVLIVSFVGALVIYLVDKNLSRMLLEDVQVAVESALAALLFFALVYGAYRLMYRRVTPGAVLFVFSILVVLVGSLALPGLGPLADFSALWMAVPVSAGARGILLGIALATIVTGIRVLLGQERAYRE